MKEGAGLWRRERGAGAAWNELAINTKRRMSPTFRAGRALGLETDRGLSSGIEAPEIMFLVTRFAPRPLEARLLALFNAITLVGPIVAKIVGEIKDFDVGEAEVVQPLVSRSHVGTTIPRAATAVENDELAFRSLGDDALQQSQSVGLRARAGIA